MSPESTAFRTLALLDTAVASTNVGDQIIMEAVERALAPLLRESLVHRVASHEWMGRKSRLLVRDADLAISGGTNLLASHMWIRSVWKLLPRDALAGLDVTLLGAGWYQDQGRPDFYTRWLLRSVLSKQRLHSVRDSHAERMLASIGIHNVINTGCPTLWSLTPEHCAAIPQAKARRVLTTLNTYIPDRRLDAELLALLRRHYDEVFIWIQTAGDREYALSLDPDLRVVAPSLEALDEVLLGENELDYVGNRLHAGIRALQQGRRSLIVEIDNRAREMGRDFKLPTVRRDAFEEIATAIEGKRSTEIELPEDAIRRWKEEIFPQPAAPGTEA